MRKSIGLMVVSFLFVLIGFPKRVVAKKTDNNNDKK